VIESSRKAKKGAQRIQDDRCLYTEGRDYVVTEKYNSGYTTEKSTGLNSRRVTKVGMYHEFKLRENEMLRSIKNLKPEYMIAAWPPTSADQVRTTKNEDKKGIGMREKLTGPKKQIKGALKKAGGK